MTSCAETMSQSSCRVWGLIDKKASSHNQLNLIQVTRPVTIGQTFGPIFTIIAFHFVSVLMSTSMHNIVQWNMHWSVCVTKNSKAMYFQHSVAQTRLVQTMCTSSQARQLQLNTPIWQRLTPMLLVILQYSTLPKDCLWISYRLPILTLASRKLTME
jgi:hypothetical protein